MSKDDKKTAGFTLSEEQLSEVVALAAQQGIEAYKEEHRKAEKEHRTYGRKPQTF